MCLCVVMLLIKLPLIETVKYLPNEMVFFFCYISRERSGLSETTSKIVNDTRVFISQNDTLKTYDQ